MKNKTRTILFLVASLILLVGVLTPVAVAREDVWGTDRLNPPFMYRLGSEMQLSPSPQCDTSDEHTPAVAYNYVQKEYLVVWDNEWPGGGRDIYARRVSDSGQVLSWFCVSTGTDNRLRPAVAYNATNGEYLVVWMKEVSSDVYEIWGRIIPWNGPGSNAEFKIISWTDRSFWIPRVAWNSYRNEYLVVWNAFNTTISFPPGVPNDIAGARISNTGSILSSSILTTYSGPHQVDITYNVAMNQYFIVFVVIHTAATSGNDIYGLRVGWDGSPVGGLIEIYRDDFAGGRKHQNHPAVATNEQDKYMVVWEHEYSSTDHDIYGREYNVNGTPDASSFPISSWTQDDTVPDVAANGANKEWVAVWQRALPSGSGYSIHGFRWGSEPGVSTYLFDVANWTFVECKNPAVAADIPGYLIVYEEKVPPNTFDIYGRLWWPEAVYLPLILRNKS
jgi:hypothetical protein